MRSLYERFQIVQDKKNILVHLLGVSFSVEYICGMEIKSNYDFIPIPQIFVTNCGFVNTIGLFVYQNVKSGNVTPGKSMYIEREAKILKFVSYYH